MSNHMAKRVNKLALINENMAASALIEGIFPKWYQKKKSLAKSLALFLDTVPLY